MRKQKFLAVVLAAVMILSLAACGSNAGGATVTATPTPGTVAQVTATATPTPEPTATTAPVVEEASIDFEDGNTGYLAVYLKPVNADTGASFAIADFNGSKALQITKTDAKKVPYVAFDLSALLGSDISKLASIEMTMGVAYADGTFNSVEGQFDAWIGSELISNTSGWSVYSATKNPYKNTFTTPDGQAFSADNNIIIVSMKTDNGAADHGNATIYIDDVRFLDASGNLLTGDTTVAFSAPAGFQNEGRDISNLALVTNSVTFEGFQLTGGSWGQNGLTMPDEFVAALVPGSVVEIEFESANGDMWIVMPDAAAGWSRIGNDGKDYVNGSKTIAQIPYELFEAVLGSDVSTWGARLQCEASGDWEVFSIKVGNAADNFAVTSAVGFEGFALAGDSWGQNGIEMTPEIIAALVPGSVVEISFTSDSGDMWIVMPDAAAGWSRVGNDGKALVIDGTSYITYEQIAAVCGDDVSTWGARMQCESSGAWEVFQIRVGKMSVLPKWKSYTSLEGFALTGGSWGQNGIEMTPEFIAALVPGSVVKIQYTSDDGAMWIVMPDAAAGWSRIGNDGADICVDGVCYITYEQIAAVIGDDVAAWGARLQCESSSAWEVFSVSVGK